MKPLIGITTDRTRRSDGSAGLSLPTAYCQTVADAGGVPVLLSQQHDLIGEYLARCDGFLLSGGDDPDTRLFGEPLHPAARLMDPHRQSFELALLSALDGSTRPVLGVCLSMQLMVLHHGGRLHQHLPDLPTLTATAGDHWNGSHRVDRILGDHPLLPPRGDVRSRHHQGVADAGDLRVLARSPDALVEAVDRPEGRVYLGVQWHPEQTEDAALGRSLVARFVEVAGGSAHRSPLL